MRAGQCQIPSGQRPREGVKLRGCDIRDRRTVTIAWYLGEGMNGSELDFVKRVHLNCGTSHGMPHHNDVTGQPFPAPFVECVSASFAYTIFSLPNDPRVSAVSFLLRPLLSLSLSHPEILRTAPWRVVMPLPSHPIRLIPKASEVN
jgi:hypothetical protein